MRTLTLLATVTLLATPFSPQLAATVRAAEPVDLALVLVSDVSRSIDDAEFQMQKEGYTAAFADPRVLSAIKSGAVGAVAVSYVEFAGTYEVRTVVDWRIIRDADGARALTQAIANAPRTAWGRTSISAGIDHAMNALATAPVEATRRVIDVAGDGTNNSGREVEAARDDAVAAGVTINGLAIINDHPVSYTFAHVQPSGGLADWYRHNVTGGPSSFVVEVHDFKAFGEAMTRKLIDEIAAIPTGHAPL